jgi:hypothetical protein
MSLRQTRSGAAGVKSRASRLRAVTELWGLHWPEGE